MKMFPQTYKAEIFKWAREEVIPLEIIKLFLLEEKHSL